MKAVILAGGEGTRLRPLSAERPKPMVKILDKPILEHILSLLRRHGITEAYITLGVMPYSVKDYFGDGSSFGMRLDYFVEEKPLGTAGSVRAACDYFNHSAEDILVISGDAVCDLDLAAFRAFHITRRADATIALSRQKELREYGVVMTDAEGRVTRFVEKPAWGQVFADTVNTGLYILSPRAISAIPRGVSYDFARDLFPGMPGVFAATVDGYWCDVGDCRAYLRCCYDILEDKVRIDRPGPRVARGITSASAIPQGTHILPPCHIAENVTIGSGVRLGPYSVIAAGSVLEDGVICERSIVNGATLSSRSVVSGAIVGEGAVVKNFAILREGSVLGDGAVVGKHAVLDEDTRVWPRKTIEDGARVTGVLTQSIERKSALFSGDGHIRGELGLDITPELCLKLGMSIACAAGGEVGISFHGGEAARITAQCIESGVNASGFDIARIDSRCASETAYAAYIHKLPATVFVKQDAQEIKISLYDSAGIAITRETERKIESLTARGDAAIARSAGSCRELYGIPEKYLSAAEAPPWAGDSSAPIHLRVSGDDADSNVLRDLLSACGAVFRNEQAIPEIRINADAERLSVIDENGAEQSHERLMSALALHELEYGSSIISVPYSAPAVLDKLCAHYGARLLRTGRDDPQARERLASTRYFADPLLMCSRLVYALRARKSTLAALCSRLPSFSVSFAEVELNGDRGAVMRSLAGTLGERPVEMFDGLRAPYAGGWIHVTPLSERSAVRIAAESMNAEMASELCDIIKYKVKSADKGQ